MADYGSGAWVRLQAMLPDVGSALRRFPIAVAIASVFTIFHLFNLDKVFALNRDEALRVPLALLAALIWALACALFAEGRTLRWRTHIVIVAAGFAAVAVLFAFPGILSFQPYIFLAALIILVGNAPYLTFGLQSPSAAFWQFNHRLWLGAGLALVGTCLFAGGLSLIIITLDLLFELRFLRGTHSAIWIVGLGLVAPINWFSLIPSNFDEPASEGDQSEFISRAVAIIVKYVLVPLLIVYTAILYVYAAKIIFDSVLPEGRLGPMVLTYGGIGTLTLLFAWPTRDTGGPLVALFWRHWFLLSICPVVLLLLAAYRRIDQYGVTEDRYLLSLAGVWLALLAILFTVCRGERDLRVLPLTLSVLLLMASFGTWGAVGMSVRSQVSQLKLILAARGRLKDGRIVPAQETGKLSRNAAVRVDSILRYLKERRSLYATRPWFNGVEDDPFAVERKDDVLHRDILALVGANRPYVASDGHSWKSILFSSSEPAAISANGAATLVGPVMLRRTNQTVPLQEVIAEASANLPMLTQGPQFLSVRTQSGEEYRFDLMALVQHIVAVQKDKVRSGRTKHSPVAIISETGTETATMLVESLRFRYIDKRFEIQHGRAWILLPGNS